MGKKTEQNKYYHISSVARLYDIHPQTLRLYEREGLLQPSRSDGNTRLYSDEDLARLELILNLSRDLGVNLAGIEIILNMRQRITASNLRSTIFGVCTDEFLCRTGRRVRKEQIALVLQSSAQDGKN